MQIYLRYSFLADRHLLYKDFFTEANNHQINKCLFYLNARGVSGTISQTGRISCRTTPSLISISCSDDYRNREKVNLRMFHYQPGVEALKLEGFHCITGLHAKSSKFAAVVRCKLSKSGFQPMSVSIKQVALRTIELEAQSVAGLASFINDDFEKAVNAIANSKGRVVVSGIGKSAIIAQKIVATFNSTGIPSIFMHAADAIHGDLGIVQQDDVVIIISKSGESPEIKVLVPLIRNFGNLLIGMVGSIESYLAKNSSLVLNTTVEQEACPHNLAPTTSTTAQFAMGDALAICLMELKGFQSDDFAKFHPGGMLGKKLYLRVSDLFRGNEKPKVLPGHSLKEVIVEMTAKRLGITAVVDNENNLLGIITDGDLRRMLEKSIAIDKIKAGDIMTVNPQSIGPGELAVDALDLLRKKEISQLVVIENGKYSGIIHLHDLIREGLI